MKTTIRMKHPLRSTGTHQAARLLRAIAPGHFRLDERSMQDLITAAHSYARMLTYVDSGGQTDGDWTVFWEVENLTYMAVLAATDTDQLRKGYEDIDLAFGQTLLEEAEKPKKGKKAAKDSSVSADFNRQLLRYLRDMAAALEKHYTTLRPEIPLKDVLLKLIARDNKFPYDPTNVDGLMQQLVAYHKAADDHLDPEPYKIFFQADSRWGIRNRDEYDCILPDETYDRQKLRGLFVQLFNISLTLKARAQQMFDAEVALLELPEETLERRLEPHIALFITFLQLFRHAQEGMNDIPRRHLDFYYHSVLGLERRPADPDHAYLIFTLAKEFSEELVEKGTLVAAGKDKKGRPIQFETLERWKVTKASIEEIRNTAIMPDYINASTISEKGIPPEKAFRPFGDDAAAPEGELGFAIASPQLFLQEGKRVVDVTLDLGGQIEYVNEFPSDVSVSYSTGDAYHVLPKLSVDETGANGFIISPLVTPFLPLQSIEPARRIVGDMMSDLCKLVPPTVTTTDNQLPAVLEIYNRYGQAGTPSAAQGATAGFLQTNIFYPALSGVNLITKILNGETYVPGTVNKYQAELHFYRAYYLWSLATVFAPALTSSNANNATSIPDLRNHEVPATGQPFQMYLLGLLYEDIKSDLYRSISKLTGKQISSSGQLASSNLSSANDSVESKTSLNIYTACAMLSRVYMQTGEWNRCIQACDIVINGGKYSVGKPTAGEERVAVAERLLSDTFNRVGTSEDVIWAMDAAISQNIDGSGSVPRSMFSFLGINDSFGRPSALRYFAESDLLNEVNKQNLRYDKRPLPPPAEEENEGPGTEEASSEAKRASKKSGKKAEDAASTAQSGLTDSPYDFRDIQYYEGANPVDDSNNPKGWFSNKYFRNGQTLVPMIRLAEVMLNKAWCLLQNPTNTSKNDTARDLINELRIRAGVLPFEESEGSTAPVYVVDTILPFHVEEERARELAFEGDRRDFVRVARSSFADKNFVVPQVAGSEVTPIGPDFYLLPGSAVPQLLTASGKAGKKQDWDSPWLYFADAIPATTAIDQARIKTSEQTSVLSLKLTLKEDAPPFLVDMNLTKAGTCHYPVLRVTFSGKDKKGEGSGFYNFLKKQTLTKATIKTTVTGIQKSLILQNDFGVFDGTQRFYPFGPVPENSARFFLGCQEAFTKKLDSVDVAFDWVEEEGIANGKKGYDEHYQNYRDRTVTPIKNYFPHPKVTIDLLKDAEFGSSLLSAKNLINPAINPQFNAAHSFSSGSMNRMVRSFALQIEDFKRTTSTEQVFKYSATQKRGFLRFKLEGDFGHRDFGTLLTKAASAQQTANLPAPPYTPATNSVSLNYVSTQVMEDAIDQFFHVLPFQGGLHQADFSQNTSLVYGYPSPTDEPQTGGFYPANLFLGMKNLVPGDNLSLLFQTLEGSELLPDDRPPRVYWMYLAANNQWTEIPVQKVLRDTTRGLTRSGMIQIATPNDLSSRGNTMLNPALLWLRASVVQTDEAPEKVGAFSSLLDIRAQAIEARFRPAEGNDLERLDSPLPAQSVSGLVESSAAVKKVEQPYATFGGRKPESEGSPEYHRRISERLRHKDRAVTAWDYERLLLEQYPLAAIAKCIPHTRYEDTKGYNGATELAPGFVTIAVVPDLVRRPNMVRTEPRFSRGDLEEMRDFLLPKTNAFVHTVENKATGKRTDYLQVVNPKYEAVSVAVKVWLVRGADQNLAVYELDQALRHFFSPWLKDPERLPQFNRVVRRSHLIQMIEQLDFVDAIEELTIKDFEDNVVSGTLISPGTARSILTTGEHLVEIADGVGGKGGAAPRAALAPPPPPGPDAGAERDAAPPIRAVEKAPAAPPISPEPATPKTATRTPKSAKRK